MSRHIHLCLDIRGAIQGTGWKCVSRGGKALKKAEAIEYLMDRLGDGKRVLPMGAPCEGFDFQKGCPGHEDGDDAALDAEATP